MTVISINKIDPNIKAENKRKNIYKKIVLGSAMTAGAIGADLFITKGKVSYILSARKITFVKNMADDIANILKKDLAKKNQLDVFFSTPGLHAIWAHRITHKLNKWKVPVIPSIISNTTRFFTGIEIHPGAQIGKKVFIDHTGAIIGETAKIGNNVEIIGRVVLGSSGKDSFYRHTIVEDNVMIGMNSTMLGRIKLGKNCKIGAGSVVTYYVPQNATVVGNPAKIITLNNKKLDNPIALKKNTASEINEGK